jgi:hypothetical protein
MVELPNGNIEDSFISYCKRYVFVLESYIKNETEDFYSTKHKNNQGSRPLDRIRKKSIEKEISRINSIIWAFEKFRKEL